MVMSTNERQGWFIVGGLGVITCLITGGAIATMGILLSPVVETFRCTSAQGSLAVSCLLIGGTLMYPVAGWLVDRVGVRWVMVLGAMLAVLSYLLAAYSHSIEVFSAALFFLGLADAAVISVPLMLIVSSWLPLHRGLAFGVIMSSSACGSAVLPSLVAYLNNHQIADWRLCMRGIALAIAIVVPPILMLVARLRPGDAPNAIDADIEVGESDAGKIVTALDWWLLVAIQCVGSFSYMATYVYVVPHLVEAGYSPQSAASMFSGIGIAAFAGYLVFGLLADRVGARKALIVGFLVAAVGMSMLLLAAMPGAGFGLAVGFVVLWGMTINLSAQLAPVLIANIAGLRHFGLLMGISLFVSSGAAALGPLITGFIYDRTGRYATAFLICVGAILLAALMTWFLRRDRADDRALVTMS